MCNNFNTKSEIVHCVQDMVPTCSKYQNTKAKAKQKNLVFSLWVSSSSSLLV